MSELRYKVTRKIEKDLRRIQIFTKQNLYKRNKNVGVAAIGDLRNSRKQEKQKEVDWGRFVIGNKIEKNHKQKNNNNLARLGTVLNSGSPKHKTKA